MSHCLLHTYLIIHAWQQEISSISFWLHYVQTKHSPQRIWRVLLLPLSWLVLWGCTSVNCDVCRTAVSEWLSDFFFPSTTARVSAFFSTPLWLPPPLSLCLPFLQYLFLCACLSLLLIGDQILWKWLLGAWQSSVWVITSPPKWSLLVEADFLWAVRLSGD